MRKKILLLLALILCMTIFVNNANAVESDTVMVMTCDYFEPSEVSHMVLYKLTNDSGNTFFEFTGNTMFGKRNGQSIDTWETVRNGEKFDVVKKLESRICPKYVLVIDQNDLLSGSWDFYGQGSTAKDIITIKKSRYIAYSVELNNGKEYKVIEGYSKDGKYGYAGVDLQNIANASLLELIFGDEVSSHQLKLIENKDIGLANYFKVDEYFPSTMIAGNGEGALFNVCKGLTEEECHNTYKYKVLISSSEEGRKNLKQELTDWLNNENNVILEGYNKISSLSKDSNFINTCKEIEEANDNSEKYDLSKINIDDFIDKLSEGFEALNEAYNVTFTDCGTNQKTSPTSAVVSCAIYSDKLKIREIADFAAKNKDYMTNQYFLVDNIYSDVKDILKEILKEKGYDINLIDAASDLNKYTKSFYTAALYLNSKGELTETQKNKLSDIIDNYKELIKEKKLGISPVVDCQTLLGDNLINKIRSYTNIIKIAIPIILIVFGIIDFTKAIFAGEDEMQKAKKQFITRIAIAVLIFIAPTIISLLLQLANKVWTIISPDSCGIF